MPPGIRLPGDARRGCPTRRSRTVRRLRARSSAHGPSRPLRPGTSPRAALLAHADCAGRPVMVVVAGALTLDPADEPDVEVRVAVQLLVEAGSGASWTNSRQRCSSRAARRRVRTSSGDRDPCLRERGREAKQRARSSQQRRRCVRLENVSHSIAETADGIQCRPRIDDRRVAPIGELVHAERLDEELDCSAPVRRNVEERVRIERRTNVEPRCVRRSSWNGAPPARSAKTMRVGQRSRPAPSQER